MCGLGACHKSLNPTANQKHGIWVEEDRRVNPISSEFKIVCQLAIGDYLVISFFLLIVVVTMEIDSDELYLSRSRVIDFYFFHNLVFSYLIILLAKFIAP